MIRIEQIQLLEKKIDKAVDLINILKKENHTLKQAIQKSQTRMNELESLLEQFKGEQSKIEEGLINALSKLDQLEDEVSDTSDQKVQARHEEPQSGLENGDTFNTDPEEIEESDLSNDHDLIDNDPPDKEIELDIF